MWILLLLLKPFLYAAAFYFAANRLGWTQKPSRARALGAGFARFVLGIAIGLPLGLALVDGEQWVAVAVFLPVRFLLWLVVTVLVYRDAPRQRGVAFAALAAVLSQLVEAIGWGGTFVGGMRGFHIC